MKLSAFDHASNELALVDSGVEFLPPNKQGSRIYYAEFTFNTGEGITVGAGKKIALAKLPARARPLLVVVSFGAMGATAALDIGIADAASGAVVSATSIAADVDVAAAGSATIVPFSADDAEAVLITEKESLVFGTAKTADFAGDKNLKGYIAYAVGS